MNAMGLKSSLPVRVYLHLVIAALTLFGIYHVLHAFYLGDAAVQRGKWGFALVFGAVLVLVSLWSALVIRRARRLVRDESRRGARS